MSEPRLKYGCDGLGRSEDGALIPIADFDYAALDRTSDQPGFDEASAALRCIFDRAAFDRYGNPVSASELGLRVAALAAELRWYAKSDCRAVAEAIGAPRATISWWRNNWAEQYKLRPKKRPPETWVSEGAQPDEGEAREMNPLNDSAPCPSEHESEVAR